MHSKRSLYHSVELATHYATALVDRLEDVWRGLFPKEKWPRKLGVCTLDSALELIYFGGVTPPLLSSAAECVAEAEAAFRSVVSCRVESPFPDLFGGRGPSSFHSAAIEAGDWLRAEFQADWSSLLQQTKKITGKPKARAWRSTELQLQIDAMTSAILSVRSKLPVISAVQFSGFRRAIADEGRRAIGAALVVEGTSPASAYVTSQISSDDRVIAKKVPNLSAEQECSHSEDFRSVVWYGQKFEFTATQARCIEILWRNREKGLVIAAAVLLERAEVSSDRVSVVFRRHPAWKSLIVPGSTKGTYKLADQVVGRRV